MGKAMQAKNAIYTKNYNRIQLLRLLRQEPLSRAALARRTGLTRAAVSLITEELIAEGSIRESAVAVEGSARGRTPVLLELCPEGGFAVGVRLSRSGCGVGVSDFTGKLLCQEQVAFPQASTVQEQLETIAQTVERLIRTVPWERILGVGVAAPGPVDSAVGKILNPPDFALWSGCEIGPLLSRRLGLPVYLENDANAAAIHNYMDHDFPGKENFLLLLVDSGVGSGVISGGTLLRSTGGFTCELGHTSINYRGPVCACGNRGCLEMYAGTGRLLAQYPKYSGWQALMDSPDAVDALRREAEYLSAAILNLTNVVRIEAVLLAGDIQAQSERIIPCIAEFLQGRSLSLGDTPLTILPALSGRDAHIQAACSIVFGHYLHAC